MDFLIDHSNKENYLPSLTVHREDSSVCLKKEFRKEAIVTYLQNAVSFTDPSISGSNAVWINLHRTTFSN